MSQSGEHIGQIRSNGTCILLSIVTLGIYGVYWVYISHEDVKLHSGEGVGGVVGVVIFVVFGITMLFMLPLEIKKMYEKEGKESPVGPGTAAWILLFGIPWYVKCQNALNAHWASHGAVAAA